MTVEEKVAQMQQLSESVTPAEVFQGFKKSGVIGSYLHVLGNETGEYLQYAESSRLQIPPIFGIDAIHGHALLKQATVFPSQLAMACSWDTEMVQRVGEITADEVAADGLNWVFSPVLCLGRDLRWGRINETFGEDAELASRMGAAIIFIAQGTPFWQAGEEMLRSKTKEDGSFDENSYCSSDKINNIKWDKLEPGNAEYEMMVAEALYKASNENIMAQKKLLESIEADINREFYNGE